MSDGNRSPPSQDTVLVYISQPHFTDMPKKDGPTLDPNDMQDSDDGVLDTDDIAGGEDEAALDDKFTATQLAILNEAEYVEASLVKRAEVSNAVIEKFVEMIKSKGRTLKGRERHALSKVSSRIVSRFQHTADVTF